MAASLDKLARDLRRSVEDVRKDSRGVVRKGALNIKNGWKADAERNTPQGYARRYPSSISFDDRRTALGYEAEIGPDKGRTQGALGNLIEYGSINNAPQNSGGRALNAEEPGFIRAMEKIADIL